ncbi:MAG: hypothetical protein WBK95_01200, partial [Sulfurimonas sp.]
REAERTYSTRQIDTEINTRISEIESQASNHFDEAIKVKNVEVKKLNLLRNEKVAILSYFTRDYGQELDLLYEEKEKITSRKNELYGKEKELRSLFSEAVEKKNQSHEELNHYKRKIDSWYARSDRTPLLFGNTGKKLPKHSIFGQSFGDLNSYKYYRDSAYEKVKRAKNEISDIKQRQHKLHEKITQEKREINTLSAQIDEIKKSRTRMYELKMAGNNNRNLKAMIDEFHWGINKLTSEISELETNKKKYILEEKNRHGIMDLESQVRRIKQEKNQFLNDFDLEENQQKRKRLHREAWLNQRATS